MKQPGCSSNNRGSTESTSRLLIGPKTIHADLVVACDGRHSTIRQSAGLEVTDSGVPIDVLWFRISRHSNDSEQLLGRINYGKALILINRGDYFQAGLIILKGGFGQPRDAGLDSLRDEIARLAPFLEDRVQELQAWDQVKLLTVQINRLRQWHLPGLLCIGDSDHAMSPAGGRRDQPRDTGCGRRRAHSRRSTAYSSLDR